MATNAKNLAELLNTDTTVAVGDIADGSVTTAKLAASAVTDAKIAGMTSSKLTGALPALDGANLTNVSPPTYGGEMLICGGGGSGGCGADGSHYGGGAGAGQVLHMLDFMLSLIHI